MKALFLFTAVIALQSLAWGQAATIRGVRMVGSGCEMTSASANTTADGKVLSLLFDNYMVEIGEGSSAPQQAVMKRNCRIFIDVDVPAGFQFGLEQTDYRGFVALPASAVGMHRFTQVVPGQPIVSMREAQLNGPLNQDYTVSVKQKPGRFPYTPCKQKSHTIELMSELMVQRLPSSKDRTLAMINLDSVDTGVNSRFILNWRRCP